MELYELIVSLAFISTNFLIIFVLNLMSPQAQTATQLNLFKLDCINLANLASVNLSSGGSRNLSVYLLEKFGNDTLKLQPKYAVRIEVERDGEKWVIGEIPENLPEKYKNFKANFIFPVLIENKIGKINITCAKVQ